MKKFIAIFTVVALMLAVMALFVSCGDEDKTEDITQNTTLDSETIASSDGIGESEESNDSDISEDKPVVTDGPYYDGVPDDTADDIYWTNNY